MKGEAMYGKVKSGLKDKQAVIRMIAVAFLVCFFAGLLLSQAFLITHAEHTHDHNGDGGGCATCAQLHSAENVRKQLGMAVGVAAVFLAGLFAMILNRWTGFSWAGAQTLVRLKIQLNH